MSKAPAVIPLEAAHTAAAAALVPTWLDRAIGVLSPQAREERVKSRVRLAASAAYVGASSSETGLKGWGTKGGDADDALDQWELETLRERSHDLMRNSPLARGSVGTAVTSIVGAGLVPKPTLDREFLGLELEEARAFEREALRLWRLWSGSKNADATRKQTFEGGLDALAFRGTLVSGDVLMIRRFKERPGAPFGLCFQLVEGHRISTPSTRQESATLRNGVETNDDGEVETYHVADKTSTSPLFPGTSDTWTAVRARDPDDRLRAELLFDRIRPDQRRGEPWLAPVVYTLKQLTRYTDAELMAAVVSSFFTVFIKTEAGATLAPFADTIGAAGWVQDPAAGEAQTTAPDYAMGHGMIWELGDNQSIDQAKMERPNTAFDGFVLALSRQVGSALGIPFEIIAKHFSASYSASRAALLEAWRFYRERRAWLSRNVHAWAYESLLEESVARRYLSAPGFFDDPHIRRAYCGCRWRGPAPGQINPKDEADGAVVRIENNISTLEREIAETSGEDVDEVLDTRELERARVAQFAGAEPSGETGTASPEVSE